MAVAWLCAWFVLCFAVRTVFVLVLVLVFVLVFVLCGLGPTLDRRSGGNKRLRAPPKAANVPCMSCVDREMGKSACVKLGLLFAPAGLFAGVPPVRFSISIRAGERGGGEKKTGRGRVGADHRSGRAGSCVLYCRDDQGGTLRLLDPPGFLTALLAPGGGHPTLCKPPTPRVLSACSRILSIHPPFTHHPPCKSRLALAHISTLRMHA